MLNPAKKGPDGVALLIGGGGPPKDAGSDDGGDAMDVVGTGETAAARAMLKAIESGNADNLRSALKNFGVACGWDDGAPEPDADDKPAEGGGKPY